MSQRERPDFHKLEKINFCYHDSMRLANKAIELDEMNEVEAAMQSYMECIKGIQDGVEIDISANAYSGPLWNDARNQQRKMLSLHTRAKDRFNHLNRHRHHCDEPFTDMSGTSRFTTESNNFTIANTTELITIPSGVQMFFVSEDSHVAATPPSYPTFMKVLVENSTECVFIQVNDWNYPLNIGQTPVFKTNSGVYLFPNKISEKITAGSVGIVISTEVDEGLIDTFECVLENLTAFQKQREEDEIDDIPAEAKSTTLHLGDFIKVPTSDGIAVGIEKGSEWFRTNISKAANYTTEAVERNSKRLMNRLDPSDDPLSVSPTVQTSLYYAHEASKATVNVSKFLINGLCAITSKVGEELAPHIKEYSKKMLPESVTGSENGEGESVVDGAVKVAGAGLSGLVTVWTELERSGLAIANAVSDATVQNVEFKYGKDAGLATSNAMGAVVNVGKTAFNLDNLGIKSIATRTAKDTGKAVFKEYGKNDHKNTSGSEV